MSIISTPDQYLLKLIIIGDCGVGKTNILVRFCNNQFKQNYVATIGVDFKIKTMNIKNQRLKFQIWDTAGQQRYKNIAKAYYKGASGIILTYSITDSKSFQNIEKWMIQINEDAPQDVVKILVANKLDLAQERQVQTKQGEVLAKKHNINFMQVSAKTGQNIRDAFTMMGESLVDQILPKLKQKQKSSTARISGFSVPSSQKKIKQCQC